MENLTELLKELAEKLGTTTEYLWAVLIKQAYVNAMTTILEMALTIIFGVVLYKVHRWLSKAPEGEKYSRYYDLEEIAIVPMILVSLFYGILVVYMFFCIQDIIIGFYNPEYWALKQVLNILGK